VIQYHESSDKDLIIPPARLWLDPDVGEQGAGLDGLDAILEGGFDEYGDPYGAS